MELIERDNLIKNILWLLREKLIEPRNTGNKVKLVIGNFHFFQNIGYFRIMMSATFTTPNFKYIVKKANGVFKGYLFKFYGHKHFVDMPIWQKIY